MVRTDPEQFPDDVPSEPRFPRGERPLHEYLREGARDHPDRTAIDYYGYEMSYAELDRAVDSFAAYLAERGYGEGDAILLYLQNCPQFYVGYHAAHRLGMQVSPCSPMSKEHRVAYQLDDGDVSVALALDSRADVVEAVREETGLADVVYARFETYLPDDPVPAVHEEMAAAIDAERRPTDETTRYFDDVVAETDPDPPDVETAMDDVVLLQYTSGTTGMPKGCEHTYWTILHKAASTATVYGFDGDTRHLAVMPVFHVAGKLNAVDSPLVDGGTVVLLTRYDPEAMLTAIDAHRPTTAWLTTPMVREMLDHPARESCDLTSFEEVPATSFGQALTEGLCARWREATGAEMFEAAYGLSETHTMDTFTRGLGVVEEGFVGRPNHNVDIVVRDWETHEELPRGEQGEISVRSPSVMKSYHDKPEKTREDFHDGYVLTGDIGRMTDEGFLYFLGRRKNMIKSSGYSVAPAEVEQVLKEHDRVENACVVARDHERRGEEVVAVVVPGDGLTEQAVLDYGEEQLAAYKRPRDVLFVDALPVTDVGKVDRERIRELV
ncbi:MAG: AMP-binding protein [Haloarculaceae archaeon]